MNAPALSLAPLQPYRGDFPDAVANLLAWEQDAAIRRARCREDNRQLSIGIVGQMKAGKSTFLNHLLFNGQPLLPKAATPKTAALTRIRYGATPRFIARFYSRDDWQALIASAQGPTDDPIAAAARELVEAARRHFRPEELDHWLAQRQVEFRGADSTDLASRIADYVAAEGRFTPLVEHSELQLPLQALMDVEIVDTPGLNDPVISRTDRTRQYLARCDVVFFLSRASQFLDESDQALLAAQLPEKGVKRLVLVGSQLDAVLLDDGHDRPSFAATVDNVTKRLSQRARSNLEQLARQRERAGAQAAATLLRQHTELVFASSFAEAFARRPPATWDDDQRYTAEQFRTLAADCWQGQMPTPADWQRISGFAELRAKLEQARQTRAAIFAEQAATLEAELARQLRTHLDNLRQRAQDRINSLRRHDIISLEAEAQAAQAQLAAISQALSGYVSEQASRARDATRALEQDLHRAANNATRLEERTGYDVRIYTVRVSNFVWYKPWTLLSGDSYETYSKTTTYRYIALSDAQEKLRLYFDDAARQIQRLFDELISPAALSAGLRRELAAALDTRRDDFDPRALRAQIETALEGINWPRLDLSPPDTHALFNGFAHEVRGSNMASLRQRLEAGVLRLQAQLNDTVQRAVAQITGELDRIAATLEAQLTRTLAEEYDQRRQALADKAAKLAHWQALVAWIDAQTGASIAG